MKKVLISSIVVMALLAGPALADEFVLAGTRGGGTEKIWRFELDGTKSVWNDGTHANFYSSWGGFALVGDKVWGSQSANPGFTIFNLDGTVSTPYIGAGYGGGGTYAHTLREGPDGNVYLLATFGTKNIRKYDTSGNYLGDLITNLPGNCQGFDFGPDGNVYASEYTLNQIDKYNGSTGALIQAGWATMPNAGPSDVHFGVDGNVYAPDPYGNVTVEVFDGSTGNLIASLTTPNDPVARMARVTTTTGSVPGVWSTVPGNESVIHWTVPPGGLNDAQYSGLGDYPIAILTVPEPVTMALLAIGGVLALLRRRR